MQKNNRIAVILITISFVFAFCFSTIFLSTNTEHECVGEGCSICAQLEQCENLLETATLVGIASTILVSGMMQLTNSKTVRQKEFVGWSLVTLKVKLSN